MHSHSASVDRSARRLVAESLGTSLAKQNLIFITGFATLTQHGWGIDVVVPNGGFIFRQINFINLGIHAVLARWHNSAQRGQQHGHR